LFWILVGEGIKREAREREKGIKSQPFLHVVWKHANFGKPLFVNYIPMFNLD
jgi:hypothetical protein